MLEQPADPITIRGHTLLCLQGFRGEGYNIAFVDRLTEIHGDLRSNPDRLVKIIQIPDTLCEACPNLYIDRCQLNGPNSEKEMKVQDTNVMTRLGIESEDTIPWKEILNRIGNKIEGSVLSDICGNCRWLPLGYCREGIEILNKKVCS